MKSSMALYTVPRLGTHLSELHPIFLCQIQAHLLYYRTTSDDTFFSWSILFTRRSSAGSFFWPKNFANPILFQGIKRGLIIDIIDQNNSTGWAHRHCYDTTLSFEATVNPNISADIGLMANVAVLLLIASWSEASLFWIRQWGHEFRLSAGTFPPGTNCSQDWFHQPLLFLQRLAWQSICKSSFLWATFFGF